MPEENQDELSIQIVVYAMEVLHCGIMDHHAIETYLNNLGIKEVLEEHACTVVVKLPKGYSVNQNQDGSSTVFNPQNEPLFTTLVRPHPYKPNIFVGYTEAIAWPDFDNNQDQRTSIKHVVEAVSAIGSIGLLLLLL